MLKMLRKLRKHTDTQIQIQYVYQSLAAYGGSVRLAATPNTSTSTNRNTNRKMSRSSCLRALSDWLQHCVGRLLQVPSMQNVFLTLKVYILNYVCKSIFYLHLFIRCDDSFFCLTRAVIWWSLSVIILTIRQLNLLTKQSNWIKLNVNH